MRNPSRRLATGLVVTCLAAIGCSADAPTRPEVLSGVESAAGELPRPINRLPGSGGEQKFRFGTRDNFAPGGATPQPDAECQQFLANYLMHPLRDEDDVTSINRTFLHTFRNLPTTIKGARVEVKLRGVSPECGNDTVGFQLRSDFQPGVNDPFQWLWFIDQFSGAPFGESDVRVLVYDLDDLPDGRGGRMSILSTLTDGTLDVVVDDDTAVDYVHLVVY